MCPNTSHNKVLLFVVSIKDGAKNFTGHANGYSPVDFDRQRR
jgi:hypothetical protein